MTANCLPQPIVCPAAAGTTHAAMPGTSKMGVVVVASLAMALSCVTWTMPAAGQSYPQPQTNLAPIGSPPPAFSSQPVGPPPGFDPYSQSTISPLSSLGGPSGYSGGIGGYPGGPIGYPPQSYPTGNPNPAYPNGGLLNGLFSGSLFNGGTSSTAGFATGLPPGAAPYSAPSIYSYGAPTVQSVNPMLGPSFPSSSPAMSTFPSTAYPSGSPNTLFPGGFSTGSLFPQGFSGLSQGSSVGPFQFVHGPRLRHTFFSGGDGSDEVGVNQTDTSIGFAFPNFLWTNQPLYVVPSFSLYLFDGPVSDAQNQQDLPSNTYGGFLDFGWQSDPNQMIGGELGVRVGSFSEFDVFNEDSVRVLGKGLVSFRLTPASTIKAGIYYLDRHDKKVLPAGGLLWQPNPFTRFDLFFPEPKFARYWQTVGTYDVWWYLAGEYGGDSWTIERANRFNNGEPLEERVDWNQINVMLGWEWGRSDLIRSGRRTGFLEVGYSFDREFDYETSPDDFGLADAFMVRAGIGY